MIYLKKKFFVDNDHHFALVKKNSTGGVGTLLSASHMIACETLSQLSDVAMFSTCDHD